MSSLLLRFVHLRLPLLLSFILTFIVLSAHANSKIKVSIFLSKNCPCSQSHEETLNTLSKEFPEMEWTGVHGNLDEIDTKEKRESSQKYFKSNFSFKVIEDLDQKEVLRLKALKTPHVFIEKDGKLIYSGGVDDSHDAKTSKISYLKTALLQIKEGKDPTPSSTRTLGCVIKRK